MADEALDRTLYSMPSSSVRKAEYNCIVFELHDPFLRKFQYDTVAIFS